MIGIFNEQEEIVRNYFENKFISEIDIYNKLLKVHENFIFATSGKIKDTDNPNWTIHLLLSQTVSLMENAVKVLSSGYLRSSEMFIRVAGEAIILSIYFKEFPDTEEEFRNTNHNAFFRTHRIPDMLKKVEESGKVFFTGKPNKKVYYNDVMFTNIYKEASKFMHNNPDVIYGLSRSQSQTTTEKYFLILGPQKYSDETFSLGFRRLFEILLFSIVVAGISLNIQADEDEMEILRTASKITNDLNTSDTDA